MIIIMNIDNLVMIDRHNSGYVNVQSRVFLMSICNKNNPKCLSSYLKQK